MNKNTESAVYVFFFGASLVHIHPLTCSEQFKSDAAEEKNVQRKSQPGVRYSKKRKETKLTEWGQNCHLRA